MHSYFRAEIIFNNVRKIFLIGYNKCATRSICNFIGKANNINEDQIHHHRRGQIASHIFSDIHNNLPILSRYPRINNVIVFADLENTSSTNGGLPIMANEYFKEIYAQYPDAYFILNYREVDDWITSRYNHNASLGHRGYFRTWKKLYKISEKEILEMWKVNFLNHIDNVRKFFDDESRKNQLLEFHINKDSHTKIIEFLDQLDFPNDVKMNRIK